MPLTELDHHVIQGYRLASPYQVGVLTANEGYLVTPRVYRSLSSPTQTVFDLEEIARRTSHLVDDILNAGLLAQAGIPRFVIPLDGPGNLDLTRTHTLGARAIVSLSASLRSPTGSGTRVGV